MNYKCLLNQQCHTVTENQLGVSQVGSRWGVSNVALSDVDYQQCMELNIVDWYHHLIKFSIL
jgi:hypothetical protein